MYLENGSELHARRTNGIFLRSAMLSSSRSSHPQGSPVVVQRAHCPKFDDMHDIHKIVINCFGQVDQLDLSIRVLIDSILLVDSFWAGAMGLVRLAMGVTRILGDVTRTLNSCT